MEEKELIRQEFPVGSKFLFIRNNEIYNEEVTKYAADGKIVRLEVHSTLFRENEPLGTYWIPVTEHMLLPYMYKIIKEESI